MAITNYVKCRCSRYGFLCCFHESSYNNDLCHDCLVSRRVMQLIIIPCEYKLYFVVMRACVLGSFTDVKCCGNLSIIISYTQVNPVKCTRHTVHDGNCLTTNWKRYGNTRKQILSLLHLCNMFAI